MKAIKDMLALSILAYKEGKYDEASRFFVSALNSEGLDSFLSEITRNPPVSKKIDSDVPESENTIAPSLAFDSLSSVVDQISSYFQSYSSYLDEGEFEEESRSMFEDMDDPTVCAAEDCCGNPPCERTANGSCPVYGGNPDEEKQEEIEVDEEEESENCTQERTTPREDVYEKKESDVAVASVGPVRFKV